MHSTLCVVPRVALTLAIILRGTAVFAQTDPGAPVKLGLQEVISRALQNSPDLQAYRHRVSRAEAMLGVANSLAFPKIDLGFSYDRLSEVPQAKQQYLGDSPNDFQAALDLSLPIFTGGRLSAERTAAARNLDQVRAEYRAKQAAVVYEARKAFYRLLSAREILDSKKELLASARSFYQTAVTMYRRRKIPRWETVLRVKVQVNEVRQDVLAARRNLLLAEKTLWFVMGVSSAQSIVAVAPQDTDDKQNDPARATAILKNNPEIIRMEKSLLQARALLGVAESGFSPQLSARARYAYEFSTISGKGQWFAGLGLSIPLGNIPKTISDSARWRAHRDEIAASLQHTKLKIQLETKSAFLKYRLARQRLQLAQANRSSSRTSLALYQARYRRGLVSSLELLDIHKSHAQALANLAAARLDLRLARAEIERLAGVVK